MDDIATSILLNTPVDVLLEIYEGGEMDRKMGLLVDKPSVRQLMTPRFVNLLCGMYDVGVTCTRFEDFLFHYDRRWNFRTMPPNYFLQRRKHAYESALVAIPHIGHNIELIDNLLESEMLTHSYPHITTVCETMYYDNDTFEKYKSRLKLKDNDNTIISYTQFFMCCANGYNIESFGYSLRNNVELLIGSCRWDDVSRWDVGTKKYDIHRCALICNNTSLFSNPDQVPDRLRKMMIMDYSRSTCRDLHCNWGMRVYRHLSVEILCLVRDKDTDGFHKILDMVGSDIRNVDKFRQLRKMGVDVTDLRCICARIIIHEEGINIPYFSRFSTTPEQADMWLHKNGFNVLRGIVEDIMLVLCDKDKCSAIDHEFLKYWLTSCSKTIGYNEKSAIRTALKDSPMLEWFNSNY